MARHLVFLIHATPTVLDRYRSALNELGDFDLVLVNAGNYSSAYVAFAHRMADSTGAIIPRLKSELLPAHRIEKHYDTTSVICFSAGYALVREMLHGPDLYSLNAIVAIDSVHASLDSSGPGGVREKDLETWRGYAEKSVGGQTLFWLGHSDVDTPQSGPKAFASTTQVAKALKGLVPEGGNWKVEAYNVRDDAGQEHIAALTEWGPEFVARALLPFLGRQEVSKTNTDRPMPPWQDPSLPIGIRCVRWAEHELMIGTKEIPAGSNTGPRIRELLAPCLRKDTEAPLNLTASNWCCALVSAAQKASLLPGDTQVHGYRAACLEVQAELMDKGLWVPAGDVLGGFYTPEVGDLVILDRSVLGKPETYWYRHICMVRQWGTGVGAFQTIGGNENDRVSITTRRVDDPKIIGFGKRINSNSAVISDELRNQVLDLVTVSLDNLARDAIKT